MTSSRQLQGPPPFLISMNAPLGCDFIFRSKIFPSTFYRKSELLKAVRHFNKDTWFFIKQPGIDLLSVNLLSKIWYVYMMNFNR